MEELVILFLMWIIGIPLLLYGTMLLHDLYERHKHRIFFDVPSLGSS